MFRFLTTLFVLLAASVNADVELTGNSTLGICGYSASCSTGGYSGACVSIGGGCCPGGTVTAGLCPGSSDIKCCTVSTCSTPSGSGHCMGTSQCSGKGGKAVSGYCAGPADVKCCITGTPTPTGYNAAAAVSWANGQCGSNSQWLCAEFAAMAVHAGGALPGVTNYGNYNGYNLRYVSQLRKALQAEGWALSGQANNCGEKGDVLIYNIDGDPDAHAAIALGGCKLDQHNPSRCGTAANWGPNRVLSKR